VKFPPPTDIFPIYLKTLDKHAEIRNNVSADKTIESLAENYVAATTASRQIFREDSVLARNISSRMLSVVRTFEVQ